MPISLPPLSRRQFLTRSLAAGAGLVFSRQLFAAGKSIDKDSWALVADVHIAADRGKLGRGINMTDNLIAVTKDILAQPKRPAGALINGDLAFNTGEDGDYATFTDLLTPLRAAQLPIHLTLGNHDQREHFWNALKKTETRLVTDKEVGMLETPRANFFLLDSLEKTLSTPGLLGDAQIDWLAKALDANQRKPALIFVHHNVNREGAPAGLKDGDKLFGVLAPRKQVKAFVFGHTHDWWLGRHDSGIHLVNLPPVAYLFKEDRPNGWVHATLQRHGMKLELRCLDTQHPQHGETRELKWRAG